MPMLADEPHGGCDVVVLDRQNIGRTAGDDARWLEQQRSSRRLAAVQQAVEQACRFHSHPACVGLHRGQSGAREVAQQFVVFDADDGHIFRHAQTELTADFRELQRPGVVCSENSDRPGQRRQPAANGAMLQPHASDQVERLARRLVIAVHHQAGTFDPPDETTLATDGEAVLSRADKPEANKTPVEQVLCGETSGSDVVVADARQQWPTHHAGDIDIRLVQILDGAGRGVIEDMPDDAGGLRARQRADGAGLGRDRGQDPVWTKFCFEDFEVFLRYFLARMAPFCNYFGWSPVWEWKDIWTQVGVNQVMQHVHEHDPWKRLLTAHDCRTARLRAG